MYVLPLKISLVGQSLLFARRLLLRFVGSVDLFSPSFTPLYSKSAAFRFISVKVGSGIFWVKRYEERV